ncbi:MAG TPA: hypothetical protein VLA43_00430, partial [Longimicrobiales bacterium]|nr:hypothetical protein [Longimicrobiales bacterium]
ALQFGDAAARAAALAALDTLGPHTASDLSNGLGFTPAGRDALQAVALAQWTRSRSPRWGFELFQSYLARGRLEQARTFYEGDGDLGEGIARFLLALATPTDAPAPPAPSACHGDALCLLLAGAEAVDRSDTRGLTAIRAAYDAPVDSARSANEQGWMDWLKAGQDALGAYEAWRRGDAHGAFLTVSRIQETPAAWGDFGAVLRTWMGQIAAQEGRTADALAYFASLEEFTPLGWYGVLLRARLHEETGDAAGAAREYRRFLDLWSDAPDDHPYVQEARRSAGA